jgi:hypothetical protein
MRHAVPNVVLRLIQIESSTCEAVLLGCGWMDLHQSDLSEASTCARLVLADRPNEGFCQGRGNAIPLRMAPD